MSGPGGSPEQSTLSTLTLDTNVHNVSAMSDDTVRKDFGFLPIPKRLQYDPEHPAHFGLLLNVIFGFGSTVVVANLYYCQPLLIELSKSFNVTYDEVSRIPTLIQAGYVIGLLTISPLGDLVRRRPFLLLLVFVSATLTIGLAVTENLVAFEAVSFLVGVNNVVPQVLITLAADLAPAARRASAMSIVLAGLLLGVLVARVLAGVVAQFVTWRVVYYIAIAIQYFLLLVLYAVIPDYPAKNKGATYWGILYSMGKFFFTEPLLIQAVFINLPSCACYSNYWVTLTFLLGGPPYNYSTLVIGLFGLVGMFGVAMAPLVGRLVDKFVPWFTTLLGILGLLVLQAIETGAGGVSIGAVIVVGFGIDVFRQMQQVSLTTAVFALDASARARLNAVLILSLFIGQVMGTAVGTEVFVRYGWRPAAALSLAWTGWMLFVILLRGPHCPRYTWFGYEGGYELWKQKSMQVEPERARDSTAVEAGGTLEQYDAGVGETNRGEKVEHTIEGKRVPMVRKQGLIHEKDASQMA
ncbi:major facilitator superfamily domain-containing protein [Amylocystis lapponica]|nr:major facilitator superfamily domain-containing protein [Amylocystis lapponica]